MCGREQTYICDQVQFMLVIECNLCAADANYDMRSREQTYICDQVQFMLIIECNLCAADTSGVRSSLQFALAIRACCLQTFAIWLDLKVNYLPSASFKGRMAPSVV
jgi:hypothetical protein